ncbi:MAG: prepilin-type N-terminal cleavage/methylation domain-containing protein [Steroidobacteraceae bacterium]|nr:prepilin-type N-terminal cleavage/methylation domain-containing protein [Steroidobacteraceae bacterium]
MGTHAPVRGFTLIELLVALAIFGLVVGIASYGYALYTQHWEGRLGRFEQAQDQYQRLDLVVAALEDTLPYVVRDAQGQAGFYFLGREDGLTLITASPVFSPGQLAVIRVFREPAAQGGWNLLYEEAPLAGVELRLATQALPFQHRLVVLRDLPDLSFGYFGWRSLQQRFEAADMPELNRKPEWATEFDGLLLRLHPQRIALRFGGLDAVVFVPERADVAFRRYSGAE